MRGNSHPGGAEGQLSAWAQQPLLPQPRLDAEWGHRTSEHPFAEAQVWAAPAVTACPG